MQATRPPYVVSLYALIILTFGIPHTYAQKKTNTRERSENRVIYLSTPSRMGFTRGQAERMGLKDMKGVPLIKASTLPRGYKMAPVTMGRKHETTKEMKSGKP